MHSLEYNLWQTFGLPLGWGRTTGSSALMQFVTVPVFHALTGCDTNSAFKGNGKKTAWQAWQVLQAVTNTFVHLAQHPFEKLTADSEHFKAIERLVVVLYDRTSSLSSVNDAREELLVGLFQENS